MPVSPLLLLPLDFTYGIPSLSRRCSTAIAPAVEGDLPSARNHLGCRCGRRWTVAPGVAQDYDENDFRYVRKRTEAAPAGAVASAGRNSGHGRPAVRVADCNTADCNTADSNTDMTPARLLKSTAALILAPVLLAVVYIAIFGWNWLRGPIERMALAKTGRALVIGGDLEFKFGWPRPRVRAAAVSFANPAWAGEKQMVVADAVEVTVDLSQLLMRTIVLPEVRLVRPVVFLEQGSGGRKNWLLDLNQQDEAARIRIDRLTLDQGRVGYDDAGQKTHIRAELSTGPQTGAPTGPSTGPLTAPATAGSLPEDAGLRFTAQGQFKGLPLKARGSGGPVLGLRDERTPYPLKTDLTVGRTGVKAEGTITSLLKFTAMDMRLALRGDSLAQLFPLLGIAFPETRAYVTEGHIVHSGETWRYEKFSGRIGDSDIAGMFEVDTGGARTAMKGDLVSGLLDFADLGPLIGARAGRVQSAKQAAAPPAQSASGTPAQARVLPDLPFNTDRWNSVDAEVSLKAKTIRRAKALPLENLDAHLSLRDSVLSLAPLSFGAAGGHLNAVITLDGRKDPIQARAQVQAKKLQLAKLLPTVDLNQASIGQVNGEFDLAGTGNSVGRMLASASGKVGLVVAGGEISKMMMEKIGLHLWEMLVLKVTGDKLVKLRCGVADFEVKDGIMRADALVFDTEVTTIFGTGSIDLGREKLDLTLNQKTKNTSPLALRSPIHIGGSLVQPDVQVDKGRMAVRGLGALALGLINPLLAIVPLIDAGPGKDSDCRQLVRDARALPHSGKKQAPGQVNAPGA
jgi:AsmA protein